MTDSSIMPLPPHIVYRRGLIAKIRFLSIYNTKLHHTETLVLRLTCLDLKEKLPKQHFVEALYYLL